MLDMKETLNEMKLIQEKADKYDDLKESVEGTMIKLDEKFKEVQDLLSDLAPVLSLKKKYSYPHKNKGYGTKMIGYIQVCYKSLIDSGEMLTLPDLLRKNNLGHLTGGSEHQVRLGLVGLKGIRIVPSSQDARKKLLHYDKSEAKIDVDQIGIILKEKNKQKEQIKVDVIDDKTELMNSMPKKYSQMG